MTAPPDLAVVVDDLGVSDLASSDLVAVDRLFCANLQVALAGGSTTDCAADSFAQFMRCFQPAGACIESSSPSLNGGVSCWDNGANIAVNDLLGTETFDYRVRKHGCALIDTNSGSPGMADWPAYANFCVSTSTYECGVNSTDMAGTPIRFSYVGGVVMCPDGTRVTIGPEFGGCAELNAALFPTCDGRSDAGVCAYP